MTPKGGMIFKLKLTPKTGEKERKSLGKNLSLEGVKVITQIGVKLAKNTLVFDKEIEVKLRPTS